MLYEIDYFTQSLGPNSSGLVFKQWQATTKEFNIEISQIQNAELKSPYMVEITANVEDDEEGEIFVDAVDYPTLEEAKAFIDGWLAATEN